MEGTFEEGLLAEVQVELTWNIELRMLETPHIIHILTSRGETKTLDPFLVGVGLFWGVFFFFFLAGRN